MGRRHKRKSISREMKRRKEQNERELKKGDDSLPSGRTLLRQAQKRANDRVKPSMRKLVPFDWNWDEDFATQLGCDDGYYQVPNLIGSHVVTPEEAEELFSYHNWIKGQRTFDGQHASRLASAMKVGVAIDIAIGPDNYPKIVNGQHTLYAIFQSGRPKQISVTVYMCRDDEGMANCYAIFDANKTRSAATVIDTHKKVGTLDWTYPASRLHKWAQCVACAENEFGQPKNRRTNSSKIEQARRPEVLKFGHWIEERIDSANQIKGLVPMGVGAGFYAMFRADPVKAERFLKMYLTGVGLTEHHPVLVLRNRLTVNKPRHEHRSTACRLHAEIMYTCWRRFCLGERMQSTRRTTCLPAWDKWSIYVPPTKATLKLGGADMEIAV